MAVTIVTSLVMASNSPVKLIPCFDLPYRKSSVRFKSASLENLTSKYTKFITSQFVTRYFRELMVLFCEICK